MNQYDGEPQGHYLVRSDSRSTGRARFASHDV